MIAEMEFVRMPGPTELLVIGLICLVPLLAAAVIILLIFLAQRRSTRDYPNLIKCPDCGRLVSKSAAACPQCGRPMSKE
jgi:hypothetical protein